MEKKQIVYQATHNDICPVSHFEINVLAHCRLDLIFAYINGPLTLSKAVCVHTFPELKVVLLSSILWFDCCCKESHCLCFPQSPVEMSQQMHMFSPFLNLWDHHAVNVASTRINF